MSTERVSLVCNLST